MLFSKKPEAVAVDIGSHSIKLVQLKRSAKGYQLKHFGIIPLPPDVFSEGEVADSEAIVSALKNLLENEKLKTKNAVTAISGHSVIVKKISVPAMGEDELAESIRFEAEQYIPFDIADVNIDFQLLSSPDETEEAAAQQMEILLVAARREKIQTFTEIIAQAGLKAITVDVDAFAVENQYELNYSTPPDETVALVNIGAGMMNINVVKNQMTAFTRDVSIGGRQVTETIARGLQVDLQTAEALKLGHEVEEHGAAEVTPLIHGVVDKLCMEIQRSFDFFRSTASGEKISRIFLSGGCACIQGIDRYMSDTFGIPVEIADPFRQIQVSDSDFDPEYIRQMAPVAAIAVGLALRGVGEG
ncbi:MAG TPA: type IV pilus assembly protein PilM [bacterium]|nr:type IV pilus assembly protein PilM [bacterium]